jgi:hypothetical protein
LVTFKKGHFSEKSLKKRVLKSLYPQPQKKRKKHLMKRARPKRRLRLKLKNQKVVRKSSFLKKTEKESRHFSQSKKLILLNFRKKSMKPILN